MPSIETGLFPEPGNPSDRSEPKALRSRLVVMTTSAMFSCTAPHHGLRHLANVPPTERGRRRTRRLPASRQPAAAPRARINAAVFGRPGAAPGAPEGAPPAAYNRHAQPGTVRQRHRASRMFPAAGPSPAASAGGSRREAGFGTDFTSSITDASRGPILGQPSYRTRAIFVCYSGR